MQIQQQNDWKRFLVRLNYRCTSLNHQIDAAHFKLFNVQKHMRVSARSEF